MTIIQDACKYLTSTTLTSMIMIQISDVVAMKDLEEPALFKPLGGIAVIANNTWAALKGREALEIEWSDSEHGNYNSKEYKHALIKSCENPVKTLRKKGDVIALSLS